MFKYLKQRKKIQIFLEILAKYFIYEKRLFSETLAGYMMMSLVKNKINIQGALPPPMAEHCLILAY